MSDRNEDIMTDNEFVAYRATTWLLRENTFLPKEGGYDFKHC